ncbi:hypothetical protein WA171_003461 [Blastocystis sp. BT1]
MDVDSSKEAKLNDSEDSKLNQTENSSLNPAMSMYYLRSFPKRDRPANFVIELTISPSPTKPVENSSYNQIVFVFVMVNYKTDALCCMRNLKASIPIHHLPIYLQYFGIHTTELTIEQYISKWYQHSPLFSYNGNTITFSPRQYVARYIPISLQKHLVLFGLSDMISKDSPSSFTETMERLKSMWDQDFKSRSTKIQDVCMHLMHSSPSVFATISSNVIVDSLLGSSYSVNNV